MIDQNEYTTLVVILNLLLLYVINFRRAKAVITELSKPAPVSKSLRFATQYSQSICTKLFAWSWKQAQQRWSYWRNTPCC